MKTKVAGIIYDEGEHAYKEVGGVSYRYRVTILTKDDRCKRGEYAEELDVMCNTTAQARRIGRRVLEADFEPGLRISRLVNLTTIH